VAQRREAAQVEAEEAAARVGAAAEEAEAEARAGAAVEAAAVEAEAEAEEEAAAEVAVIPVLPQEQVVRAGEQLGWVREVQQPTAAPGRSALPVWVWVWV
jgi:hypothetical protein